LYRLVLSAADPRIDHIPLATLLKSLKQATQPSEQTARSFNGGARRAGGGRLRLCSWSLGAAGLEKSARRQQAEKRYHKRFSDVSSRNRRTDDIIEASHVFHSHLYSRTQAFASYSAAPH
jgi:hypothetical protein